jgi:hypothetical protein
MRQDSTKFHASYQVFMRTFPFSNVTPKNIVRHHPQIDGQNERVNQILEDMLRACALQYRRSWDKSLPYVEFTYNNSYQESISNGAIFKLS